MTATPHARRVLLTDGGAKSTLAAARSLHARGIEVHVAAESRVAMALWSRSASRRHIVPGSRTSPDAFVKALAALQETCHFDAVLPVSDDDIAALLEREASWRESGMKVALPSLNAFEVARDKSQTLKAAIAVGVPCPETWFPDERPLQEIAAEAVYPLLVKPNVSAGARGITLVEGPALLQETYDRVVNAYGPCHLQEWIPEGGAQYKADALVGPCGRMLGTFVCRKLRYYPVKGGSSTLIVSDRHASIADGVERLLKHLGWYGFADFDFIVDPRDGVAKLMECNPRFPESLAVNVFAGADFPWALFQLASTGEAETLASYDLGRYARFLVGDVMWFLHSQERFRAQPSFFRFIDEHLTYYVERWDDPGPALCSLVEAVRTLASPAQRRYRFARGFRRRTAAGR